MSHLRGYMPRKDAEFIAWVKTIYYDCHENAEEWEIPSEVISQFSDIVDIAEEAFQSNADKERRNKASVSVKNAAFLSLKKFFFCGLLIF
jgi:hypothetical protein